MRLPMYLSKRNGTFYVCYLSELGIERRASTKCKTKRDALNFLKSFKEKEHERKLALQRRLFSDFCEDYHTYSKSIHTPQTAEVYQSACREFKKIIGNLPMQSIGVREIERFLSKKKEEASEWTARRCYISLASAFEKAKQWDLILENPFRKVEKPKVREMAPCYFSLEQFQILISFILDRDFKELCITALTTGMRLSELAALKWKDIDLARRILFVQNSETFTTKTKRNRVIPISDMLFKVLFERKERISSECDLVFNRQGERLSKDYISKKFKKYVIQSKIDKRLHFHSLRHSFASLLVQQGVSIYAVQKFLGHSTIAVTQIYSHLQPESLHSEVNKILVSLN
jgi:site-specific recombinase XerD